MDQPRTTTVPIQRATTLEPPATPSRCVFCAKPVAAHDRCPLLPSSHWACCACEAPAAASHDAA
jgi:hypothetical protein